MATSTSKVSRLQSFVLGFVAAAALAVVLAWVFHWNVRVPNAGPAAPVPERAATPLPRSSPAVGHDDRPRHSIPSPSPQVPHSPHPEPPALAAPAPPAAARPAAHPADADALVTAAFREIDAKEYLAGRALAERCLESDATNIQCHHAIVFSYVRQGDDEGAARPIDACLAVDPNDPWCLGSLALGDLRAGRLTEAGTVLEQLQHIDPDGVDTLVLTGELAEKARDVGRACEAFGKACDKGQPFACARVKEICR